MFCSIEGSCIQSVMRDSADDVSSPPKPWNGFFKEVLANGHGLGETLLEELFTHYATMQITMLFWKHVFNIHKEHVFFHQQVWGCIANDCQCMMCNFDLFFSGWAGIIAEYCRSPRKPLDESHMQQHSNSLLFVFVAAGLFSSGTLIMSQDARLERIW